MDAIEKKPVPVGRHWKRACPWWWTSLEKSLSLVVDVIEKKPVPGGWTPLKRSLSLVVDVIEKSLSLVVNVIEKEPVPEAMGLSCQ